MRDLAMLAAMCILLPMAIRRPFVSYVLWAWTGMLSASFYLYGFMGSVRFNLIFACIALFSIVVTSSKWPSVPKKQQTLLLLFLAHATLCWLFGYSENPLNSKIYADIVKALLFCLVMPAFVTNRLRLHVLLVAIAIGMGFHGIVEGAKFIASGGGHKITGVATAMISDNNHFAVGQLMILPLLFFLYKYSSQRLIRLGFLVALILAAFSVMGTFSRGGFIGLSALGIWFFLSSRRKLLSLLLVSVFALSMAQFAPESWFTRIDTISEANQDDSFMTRVIAWKVSTMIALSNPVFGGGFHAVQSLPVWTEYRDTIGLFSFIPTPETPIVGRAAHSIYFEVLGDMGFVGLILFLAIWVNAWRTALSIKRTSHGNPELLWASDLADMLRLSFLAYAISGAAVSMGYFELFYIYVMAIAVLEKHVLQKTTLLVRNKSVDSVSPLLIKPNYASAHRN